DRIDLDELAWKFLLRADVPMVVGNLREWDRAVDVSLDAGADEVPETIERRLRMGPDADHRLALQVHRTQVKRHVLGDESPGADDHPEPRERRAQLCEHVGGRRVVDRYRHPLAVGE